MSTFREQAKKSAKMAVQQPPKDDISFENEVETEDQKDDSVFNMNFDKCSAKEEPERRMLTHDCVRNPHAVSHSDEKKVSVVFSLKSDTDEFDMNDEGTEIQRHFTVSQALMNARRIIRKSCLDCLNANDDSDVMMLRAAINQRIKHLKADNHEMH